MKRKECKGCKKEQEYTEFYLFKEGKHSTICRECYCEKERLKRLKKNPNLKPKPRRKSFVKGHWKGAVLTLSDREIKTNEIRLEDIQQIISEGFGFILKSKIN